MFMQKTYEQKLLKLLIWKHFSEFAKKVKDINQMQETCFKQWRWSTRMPKSTASALVNKEQPTVL